MENWKIIGNFEDYEVSDLGRVRRATPCMGTKVGKILRPTKTKRRYLQIGMHTQGKYHTELVHRLVAKAFLPNPLNLPEVNHTGRKSDNRAIKLEWRSKAGHKLDIARRGQWGEGVSLNKTAKKWVAYYNPKPRERVYLGIFKTKKKALEVRRAAIQTLPEVI